ncbi:MAG: hypothetical protein AAGF97_17885, partial [Planctomycetota bacterium]
FDQDFTSEATFRTAWSVPASAQVIGIEWGSLANSPSAQSEILQLLDNAGNVQDEVNYDDSGDWPSDSPDGPSITLTDVATDNNVGTNWARSEAGVAQAINPTSPFSTEDVGSPGFAARDVDGDFDDDGSYGIADVDALVAAIVFGSHDPLFDLTEDGLVDQMDLDAWLQEAGEANLGTGLRYLAGDANLDGVVDGQDFIAWNNNKFSNTAAWSAGDFNADGLVDGRDFIIWNNNKFQTSDAQPLTKRVSALLWGSSEDR